VHQAPGLDGFPFDVGKDREFEAETVRESAVLLDGVDRDRDDFGAGGVDVFKA